MPEGFYRSLEARAPDYAESASGLRAGKFCDPKRTSDGSQRANVAFDHLETLWINTGTQCNIECAHCYIESSPKNDRLSYVTVDDVQPFLDEALQMNADEIGLTGGEPFLNPATPKIIEEALVRGFSVLVLTNAMRPLMRPKVQDEIRRLIKSYGSRLKFRVSLDHYTAQGHDEERGPGAFKAALEGIHWLNREGAAFSIAGRQAFCENEEKARNGYGGLLNSQGLALDVYNPAALVLFPEMSETADPPEITQTCWEILEKDPRDVMCASSRMVIKRKGAATATVTACTLIAYEEDFELGTNLAEATRQPVVLNHQSCASFCVLGGASCSV